MAQAFDVVFFAPWIGPLLVAHPTRSSGGAETQLLMLARGIAGRGLRVAVVSFEIDRPSPDTVDGVSVLTVPTPRARVVPLRKLLRGLRVCMLLARVRTRVVVQRISGPETGLVALIARLRGQHFVFSSANVYDFDYGRVNRDPLSRRIYELGVRLAHTVVVQTPEQAELCRRRFGRDPVAISSVAEPAEPRRGRPDAFLWISRLDGYKRPEAYLELARALPEARFRMVAMPMGDEGPERFDALRRSADGIGNLELLGPRPRAELSRLIERSVAVVNTSDFEGMPNVFLEGWARGVPALALTHDPDGVIVREGLGAFAGDRKSVM